MKRLMLLNQGTPHPSRVGSNYHSAIDWQAANMTNAVYDTLGLLGSFVISASLVPQITKVIRTKSASDLSLTFQVSYVMGLIMILIYGIGEARWPIYIPCSIELLGGLALLAMKYYYDAQEAKHDLIMSDADVDPGSKAPASSTESKLVQTP